MDRFLLGARRWRSAAGRLTAVGSAAGGFSKLQLRGPFLLTGCGEFVESDWSLKVKSSTALRLDASSLCQRLAKEPASVDSFACSFVPADDLLDEKVEKNIKVHGGEGWILKRRAPDIVLVKKGVPFPP